jgi:AraC-like DNA-binding protein
MDQKVKYLAAADAPAHAGPARTDLAAAINRLAPIDGEHKTAIASLSLYRCSRQTHLQCSINHAALLLAVQGTKRMVVADEAYEFDSQRFLVASVDLPVLSQITEASIERPYLCMVLKLDQQRIADLMTEMRLSKFNAAPSSRGIAIGALSDPLFDAAARLVQLLDTPADIPILAPLVERELLYRLLTSEQSASLRHIAAGDSQTNRVAKAIEWLKNHYFEPLHVAELAQRVNMSVSSLHHHFKEVTALSPLQYQKQLRLHEARRLLMRQSGDVSTVALMVGYESSSQFSREYSRLFGAPPLRDMTQLQQQMTGAPQ